MKILFEKDRQIVQTFSKNGRTPLHTACLHSQFEAVKLILQISDDRIDLKTDSCGNLPIMDSVRAGSSLEILDFLAALNPDSIYQKDILNRNVLHIASESGHVKVLQHLIKNHGMDVNDTSSPTTPLHWAAKEGQAQAISALLDLGADPQYSIFGHFFLLFILLRSHFDHIN